ncbi:uncharacterized protein [Panulirus ornatus]|uniref:uncharacterized protein n=1 Tax=Panulirus ornatus TaxID=150431 RepID=UPI003A8A4354
MCVDVTKITGKRLARSSSLEYDIAQRAWARHWLLDWIVGRPSCWKPQLSGPHGHHSPGRFVTGLAYRFVTGPTYSFLTGPTYSFLTGPTYSFLTGPTYSFLRGPTYSFLTGPTYSFLRGPTYSFLTGPTYGFFNEPTSNFLPISTRFIYHTWTVFIVLIITSSLATNKKTYTNIRYYKYNMNKNP